MAPPVKRACAATLGLACVIVALLGVGCALVGVADFLQRIGFRPFILVGFGSLAAVGGMIGITKFWED